MKKIKLLVQSFLVLVFVLSLIACGSDKQIDNSVDDQVKETVIEQHTENGWDVTEIVEKEGDSTKIVFFYCKGSGESRSCLLAEDEARQKSLKKSGYKIDKENPDGVAFIGETVLIQRYNLQLLNSKAIKDHKKMYKDMGMWACNINVETVDGKTIYRIDFDQVDVKVLNKKGEKQYHYYTMKAITLQKDTTLK